MSAAGGQGRAESAAAGSGAAESAAETLVVGIGQPLAGDDAVGLVVAERLRTMGIPARTVPDGAALADLLSAVRRAIVVDAVVGAGPAGTVVCLDGDDLARGRAAPVSSHGISITLAVSIARALGGAEDVRLVGIAIDAPRPFAQPPAWGAGAVPTTDAAATLSIDVAAAVEDAARRVQDLLTPTGQAP